MSVVVLRIDQRQGALDAGFALPQQHNDRIVRPRQQPLRPLFVERRDRPFQPIDAGDKGAEVKARRLRRLRILRHDRDAPRPAIFEAHRHHDAGREGCRKGIGLPVMRLDLAIWEAGGHQFCDEPLGVMALREPDRRRDMAEAVILVEQPRALEIPPLDAVEQIVEPGCGERLDLIQRGAEIFGEEQDLGVD